MNRLEAQTNRRRLALTLALFGTASTLLAWQWGPRSLAYAQDVADQWFSEGPIGEFYTHSQDEFPHPQLGDVPQDNDSPETHVDPRSLGDTRVRQFDELDRPRFKDRETHRGVQINEERFSVVSMTGQEDAILAANEFGRAWDEFSKLADTFTDAHRNPDFGISQLMIVIEDEPIRERDEPKRTLQIQNGQTIVYINAAEGQPPLSEQLPELRQGAVHALLHLAELDRKFPLWAQQGLAEYTAEKLAKRDAAAEKADEDAENEGLETAEHTSDETQSPKYDEVQFTSDDADSPKNVVSTEDVEEDTMTARPVDVEYWRLQRAVQDRLDESVDEEEAEASDALARVQFLLEGDDAQHAPQFLLALRAIAEEPTDPLLASRAELSNTQLLPPAIDTVVDELFEELESDFVAWQADPLRGQPVYEPTAEITNPAILSRAKDMEIVLKLAYRQTQASTTSDIRPSVMEFGAEGQRDVSTGFATSTAINVEQLYYALIDTDTPWATLDANGELLLWHQEDELAQVLGVEDHRYSSEFRDGHWVLVHDWDESTQLEAWLEPNPADASRPLVKLASRQRDSQIRIVELDARARAR